MAAACQLQGRLTPFHTFSSSSSSSSSSLQNPNGETKQKTFQFAPREVVIRLNDLDTAELSFAGGMIMSTAGSSDQDVWPIRKLLRQFFEQTLLKWLRTRGYKWSIGHSYSRTYSGVMDARRVAQKQLRRC